MLKKVLSLWLFLLLSAFIQFNPQRASAQAVGIRFSPTRIEEVVDPGQLLYKSVEVTNDSEAPVTLYIYLKDFKADGESGSAKLLPPGEGGETSLSSWVEASKEGMDFAPGEKKIVYFNVQVPANIGPGGYYGAVIFGTIPPDIRINSEDKGAAISIAQQAGPLLLFQVKGEVDERALIREFNTEKEVYGTPYSVKFITRIEDQGNVHIKPRGYITVKNLFGKEVSNITFNTSGSNILPKTIRKFENTWEDKMGFGRYEAELAISYGTPAEQGGQGMQSLFISKTFWIIPWKIVIPVTLALAMMAALAILFLKFYKNKAVKRAMEQMGVGQIRYVRKQNGPSAATHFALVISALLVIVFLAVMFAYFLFIA